MSWEVEKIGWERIREEKLSCKETKCLFLYYPLLT